MTTKRLAILFLFVSAGLSLIFLLPKYKEQPTGIRLELPNYLGEWTGVPTEVTEEEKSVLGKDTRFARMRYENHAMNRYGLLASIVLSGSDMSTSIHRPERCLQAQGWNVIDKTQKTITLPELGTFPIMRLHNTRIGRDGEGKETHTRSVTCYWFVGSEDITAGHWSRWYIDNRDRLLKGVSQRWAFITVTGIVPNTKPEQADLALKLTEETVMKFITSLAPRIHKESLSYH